MLKKTSKKFSDSFRKPSPRLSHFSYEGYYCYFITCCTFNAFEFFKEERVIKAVKKILCETAKRNKFFIYCFCFMPDHLHFLLGGEDENSSLKDFMRIFKQRSSFVIKKMTGKRLWQRSYYDHILRKVESLEEICEYILNNPVRKGLVKNYQEYPYSSLFIKDMLGQT